LNFHFLLRRLLGKPTCELGLNTTISSSAKILNAGESSQRIVIGHNSRIEGELFVFAHGGRVNIGDWCFIGPGTRIWSAVNVTIKNRVLISHNVNIFDSLTHPIDSTQRHRQFVDIVTTGHPKEINLDPKPIVIEDDAWIGAGAMIMRGVRIGARSIVGAGALVTQNLPDDVVAVGNPARIVRDLRES